MEALFTGGLFAVIGIIISIILMIVGMFLHEIHLFDGIALGLIAGLCAKQFLSIHPAFCLLIGIAIFFLIFGLLQTKVGFWIITILISAAYALIISTIVYSETGKDPIWEWVSFGIAFVVIVFLHLTCREKK